MVFVPDLHGFFDDLVTMLVSLSSYMFAMHVSMASNHPKPLQERSRDELLSYILPLKIVDWPLSLGCLATSQNLVVYPTMLLMAIALDGWPQFIEYTLVPNQESRPDYSLSGQSNKRVVSSIVGTSYTNHYSRCEPIVKSRYGNRPDGWPEVFRFAWALRNGFAHGGTIALDDSELRPIRWKIWSLDSSYSGRNCLFDDGMPGIGDIVLLMQELDELVRSLRSDLKSSSQE